jgi:hypothetical protein
MPEVLVFPQRYQTMEQLCLPENNSIYQGTSLFYAYKHKCKREIKLFPKRVPFTLECMSLI